MTPCQKLLKQEGTERRIESMQQSSATPKNQRCVGRGLPKIVACSQSSWRWGRTTAHALKWTLTPIQWERNRTTAVIIHMCQSLSCLLSAMRHYIIVEPDTCSCTIMHWCCAIILTDGIHPAWKRAGPHVIQFKCLLYI